MAQRFISLEEAAKKLGVTKERLNELREAGKARAFRDGSSWKFKEDEVERLATQGLAAAESEAESTDIAESPEVGDQNTAEGSDSILLSELELGAPEEETGSSSTIIGEDEAGGRDSDLELPADVSTGQSSELGLETDSDLRLNGDEASRLEGGESNVLSGTIGGSGVLEPKPPEAPGSQFENLEELDLDLDVGSSQLSFTDDSAIGNVQPVVADTEKASQDDQAPETPRAESSIKLMADDDDEVVLGEESASDITIDGEQSGISLVDAADTGISLDEAPVDLGSSASNLGGSALESFDLGGDSTLTVSEPPEGDSSDSGQDDDFVLTTSGDTATGSGSQVVAFDLESGVDENTATILGGEPALGSGLEATGGSASGLLEEEVEPAADLTTTPGPTAPAGAVAVPAFRQTEYSGWNITFLVLCALLLSLSGAMMFDLLRSMWSWNAPYTLNSTIMDAILNALF